MALLREETTEMRHAGQVSGTPAAESRLGPTTSILSLAYTVTGRTRGLPSPTLLLATPVKLAAMETAKGPRTLPKAHTPRRHRDTRCSWPAGNGTPRYNSDSFYLIPRDTRGRDKKLN